jgi:pimeloyl-ACP methyl ester carboxylesterase
MRKSHLVVNTLLVCTLGISASVASAKGKAKAEPKAKAEAKEAFTAHVTGSGRPVVFIPDLEAPGSVWDTTVAHLGGKFETHVIDVAGFAGNPPFNGPLMPALHDGLANYLRDHAKGAVLVGHMYGAQVAYWLAMTNPDLVGGVIAIDAPPSRSDGTPDPEAAEGRDGMAKAKPQQFAKGVTRRIGSMMADQTKAKALAEKAAKSTQSVCAETFFDMMTRDLRSQIPNIKSPVLTVLTTGNLPAEIEPEVEKMYQEQLAPIPHHELLVVKDAKHYVMYDQPDAFFAALDRFLAANASAAPAVATPTPTPTPTPAPTPTATPAAAPGK